MSTELQHVINTIETSTIRNIPYEYCLLENIFSESFYEELINNLPDDNQYAQTSYKSEVKQGNPIRYKFSLKNLNSHTLALLPDNHPLIVLSNILRSRELYDAFSNLFSNINKSKDVAVNAYLFRDKAGYKLAPHPDAIYKIMSLIIYLAKDDSYKEVGTIINTKEKDGQFIKHDLIEYKRNSGFIFPVTDTSFHSVDIVTHKNFSRNTIANFYGPSDSFMVPLI